MKFGMNSRLIAFSIFCVKEIESNRAMVTRMKNNSRKLDYSGVSGFHGDTTLVGSASDVSVAGHSPCGAPLVADYPVRCGAANAVTDDGHLVVQAHIVGQAGGIAEHARAEMN
jgi:hypothetical protein